jgi:hypothetical protein
VLRFLLAILLESVVYALVVVWVIRQPGPLSIGVMLTLSMLATPAILTAAFHWLWRPMVAPYPPHEPAEDAVRRSYQSFGLGLFNMTFSMHAAVDDEHLHLVPLRIWRVLGATPLSIPWSAMEPARPRGLAARIGGRHVLRGPRWCMSLVDPEGPRADDQAGA